MCGFRGERRGAAGLQVYTGGRGLKPVSNEARISDQREPGCSQGVARGSMKRDWKRLALRCSNPSWSGAASLGTHSRQNRAAGV